MSSRNGCWNHLAHLADFRRCVRLGIECLVLTGAAVLKKKDYRLAGERVPLALGQGLDAEQR